jgi:EmrB/QacA subfamily drug resistance transporter
MDEQNARSVKTWTLALTSVGSLMAILDTMVVAVAMSTIQKDLGISLDTLQWTVNAYNLSFGVLLLTGATLGDRFGRRLMFIVGIAVFLAASVACASAQSATWLIASRAVQGAGAALIVPISMGLLGAAFPGAERAKALGLYSSITGLALIAGPMVGGILAQGIAWPWIFWINVPIGLALIPLVRHHVPESFGPQASIDMPGVLLLIGASLGIIWGLIRSNNVGWGSSEVIGSLVCGVGLTVAFVLCEQRMPAAMVPMRFFRSRAFAWGVTTSLFLYAAMYALVFFLPQFLQVAQHHTPIEAGLRMLPLTATLFFIAPIAGRLVPRFGERSLVVSGLGMQAIALGWISLVIAPAVPYVSLIIPLVLAGAGISMAIPAVQNAILSSVQLQEVGKAAGVFNTFRFLGGVAGVAVAVTVFSTTGSFESAAAISHGIAVTIGASSIWSLIGALCGLGLSGKKTSPATTSLSSTSGRSPGERETDAR